MPIEALITAGLSATKTGFDLARSIREALKKEKVDPKEISNQLIELQELLLQAKTALISAQDEKTELVKKIEELQRANAIGAQFEFDEGVYWFRNYPYCPNCWDADKKPTRLDGPFFSNDRSKHSWTCSVHKSKYYLHNRGHN